MQYRSPLCKFTRSGHISVEMKIVFLMFKEEYCDVTVMLVMQLDIRVKEGTLRKTVWLVLSVMLKDKGAVLCSGILDPYYTYI